MALIAGIEAGGTKFVCALADGPQHILLEERFPTTTPQETLGRALAFFEEGIRTLQKGPLMSMGIASFGPLDLNHRSKTYGHITTTPKPGWQNVDLCGFFSQKLGIGVGLETDVNAAALAEGYVGEGRDLSCFIYITVGTGFGGGIIVNGGPIHGLMHPEMGHLPLRLREGDNFQGVCPYHGRCVEGLCSGPAIEARWGVPASELAPDHEAWDGEAYYLAQALMAYVLTVSPERIIMGGGVMHHQRQLFPKIRAYLQELLNGYLVDLATLGERGDFIVPPALGNKAGIVGALVVADELHTLKDK